jgi:hypothetical protein
LHHGQVGPRIGSHDPTPKVTAVIQPYANSAQAVDDMMIGEKESIRGEKDPRAGTLSSLAAAEVDHRRAQSLSHFYHHLGIGIKSLVFLRKWIGRGNRTGALVIVADKVLPESGHESALLKKYLFSFPFYWGMSRSLDKRQERAARAKTVFPAKSIKHRSADASIAG